MNNQISPASDETEADLPTSNTLGGTSSTGAGPDGDQPNVPESETLGLGHDDLGKADDVARRVNERNQEKA